MLDQTSRLLPGYALYPATFVLLIALLLAMRSTSLLSGRFLIAIVWLRYVMQAYHDITHAPLLGGASLNRARRLHDRVHPVAIGDFVDFLFAFQVLKRRIREHLMHVLRAKIPSAKIDPQYGSKPLFYVGLCL
jgi:hypothetical protein